MGTEGRALHVTATSLTLQYLTARPHERPMTTLAPSQRPLPSFRRASLGFLTSTAALAAAMLLIASLGVHG